MKNEKLKKNLSLISYSLSLKNTWAQGRYNFTDDEYRTLKQIADADPMVKGPAVYNAQVLLMTISAMNQRMLDDGKNPDNEPGNNKDKITAGNLYPNPTNNDVTLNYTIGSNNEGYIYLFDITGKLIIKEKLLPDNNKQTISTNQLNLGVYLYNIIVDKQVIKTGKLVVIK